MPKLTGIPRDDDALPSSVRVNLWDGDAWYEYDGDLLFTEGDIQRLWEIYQEMKDTDWHRVATVKTDPDTSRVKIRTKDADACQQAIDERFEEVNAGEHQFVMSKGSLLGNHHGIHEEGPRKSVAWAHYNCGEYVGLGGAKGKRQKLRLSVRSFEQWIYHTKIWLPIVQEYHEKYPY